MAHVTKNANSPGRAERRRSPRHRLCLDGEAQTSTGLVVPVVIQDLSQSGFLMETVVPLGVGEPLQLLLPEDGGVAARVVWSCGGHFGCEFQRPLSAAAVSAALLKARPARDGEGVPPRLRLEWGEAKSEVASHATGASQNYLTLILATSVLLWSALAAAVLYTS